LLRATKDYQSHQNFSSLGAGVMGDTGWSAVVGAVSAETRTKLGRTDADVSKGSGGAWGGAAEGTGAAVDDLKWRSRPLCE
jgi:hypothetical protein